MDRRKFLVGSGAALAGTLMASGNLFGGNANAGGKPNILFIMADDLGYGEIAALNPERGKIPTPNIDKLATEGMTFTDAHAGASVCTPTRYGLLTGRYAWRTKLQSGVSTGHSPCLIDQSTLTIAEMLKQKGYDTGIVGKWHLDYVYADPETGEKLGHEHKYGPPVGSLIKDGPLEHGFDYFYGFHHSRDMKTVAENDRVVAHRSAVTMLPGIEEQSIEYIRDHAKGAAKDNPFFLYVALSSPHSPVVPAKDWQGKSGLNKHADFVMQTDHTVGEIIKTLDEAGLRENTLVVFTSDNGTSAPTANKKQLERMGHYPSWKLRGAKADIWDGGHRVPFIVRWPERIESGSECPDLTCHTDFMPTVAEIVAFQLPPDAAVDGFGYLEALIEGERKSPRPPVVHHSISGRFAIRDGKWKLELCPGSGGWSAPKDKQAGKQGLPEVQLYNIQEDIGEQNNLQAEYPERVEEMTATLEDIVQRGRSTPGPQQENDVKKIDIWKK